MLHLVLIYPPGVEQWNIEPTIGGAEVAVPGRPLPEPMWYGRVWSVCGLCRCCWQGGWRACLNVGAPGADPPTFVAAQVDGQGSGPMLWALGLGWDVLKQGVFQCDGVVATKAIPFGSPFLAALIVRWGPMHVAIGQFPPGFILGCLARAREKKSVAAE